MHHRHIGNESDETPFAAPLSRLWAVYWPERRWDEAKQHEPEYSRDTNVTTINIPGVE